MDTKEKELYSAIIIAVVVLTAILVFFIISIIRQQRRYHIINRQKINAEITTLENERKRIAADLHDEVGPLLSAVKLQINHLELPEDKQTADLIQKSSNYIDEVIRKMREISNDLLPNILVRKGLPAAIQDYLGKLSSASNLKIDFQFVADSRIEQTIEVNMYRIVQEIVHNAVKHARAANLVIRLQMKDNQLRLSTEDDGIGFNMNDVANTKNGLGLLNLQSRTEVMNGEFSFESQTGKGTKYLFEIPLKTVV